jgi:glutamine amidotransferase
MSTIALIDHGAGNLVSIRQALESSGAEVHIATRPSDLAGADALVLPGVGATGAAMTRLREAELVEPLRRWDGPLLGICVGLQLFFETSDEDGGTCLGIVPGAVRRLSAPRLPHIGWNELTTRDQDEPLLAGVPDDATFYFVHSFAPVPEDAVHVVATSSYEQEFVAAVRVGNRVGVQFHPERSGRHGLRMIENFVRSVAGGVRAA